MAGVNEFEGRVGLVTGGGRGIGAATATVLHERGASVVVADLDQDPIAHLVRELGPRSAGAICDVTSRESVESAVARAVGEFGRLDHLICSAGVTRDNLIHKMTDSDWDSVIQTHLTGAFLCSQVAQRQMVQQRYGKIVFLSSASALGNRGQANYSTAKAGLQGLTRTLAIELGPFNINVNAVAPGFVETRMTEETARRLGLDYEEYKKHRAEAIPLRRTALARDIATVIAFLCSDDSRNITGQTIYARGGP